MLGPGMFSFSTALGVVIAFRSSRRVSPRIPALFVLLALAIPLVYYGWAAAYSVLIRHANSRFKPVTIAGEIVDQSGTPVEGYDVAYSWSANGVIWDRYGNYVSVDPSAWTNEGEMEPHPTATALSLPQGCFRLQFPGEPGNISLLAKSKNSNSGGMVLVGKEVARTPVVIPVYPLVNLHGSVVCRENSVVPKLTDVYLYPSSDEGKYAPVAHCRSVRGFFSFWLPPGSYELNIRTSQPTARIPRSREDQEAPEGIRLATGRLRVTIDGSESQLDLGQLHLHIESGE